VLWLLENRHVTLRLRDGLDEIEALALQHTAEEFLVLGVKPPAISGARWWWWWWWRWWWW
jgi:hypothetical protein